MVTAHQAFDAHNYPSVKALTQLGRRLFPVMQGSGLAGLTANAPIDRVRLQAWLDEAWPQHLRQQAGEAEAALAGRHLRIFRQGAMLAIAERDLSGKASLDENLASISALAELCIQASYEAAMAQLCAKHGRPMDSEGQPLDLLMVGMGKLGGGELNASSDIDLIPLIADDGETEGVNGRGVIDAQSFFTRVVRLQTQLLSDPTAEGFAFRVDLRLRPNGGSGPVIHTLSMLENYLVVQGREWERYAWVKARVVNRPVAGQAERFAQQVQAMEDIRLPFVYRRYLDYNALSALRELHAQIREEAGRRAGRRQVRSSVGGGDGGMATSEHAGCDEIDVKLGPGGIREIEFVAQLFQLIRGGREADLRERGTRAVLETLRRQQRLSSDEVDALQVAYAFWRRLEHRLQYWADEQTHTLAGDLQAYERMAAAMGLPLSDFQQTCATQAQAVTDIFERLFRREDQAAATPDMPAPARRESRLARLQARVEARASASANPESLRQGMAQIFEALARRDAYLALFDEYPEALERVARLAEASPWAVGYLRRHPIVLDELLDSRTLFDAPDDDALRTELQRQLSAATLQGEPDVERQMDILREVHHAALFRLLVQDLEGLWTVERLSDQLSSLADAVIDATLGQAWKASPKRHRETPAFAVVAYGRLGGKELGYASDLDLIFLFDDPHELAQERYAKFAQRITMWLSTTTAAGQLFEIDLRLRPNGNAGLLVTDLAGFLNYQEHQAWVWEHQALTRARFCAGDPAIGRAFEEGRRAVLAMPRSPEALLEEILAMRLRMHEGHPNASGLFDLKHDAGGMVDIEFMVQALVLGHAHQHPCLLDNAGNIALLGRAADAGLVPKDLATRAADAYRLFRKEQHRLRLAGGNAARLPAEGPIAEAREAVQRLWGLVFAMAPRSPRSLADIRGRAF